MNKLSLSLKYAPLLFGLVFGTTPAFSQDSQDQILVDAREYEKLVTMAETFRKRRRVVTVSGAGFIHRKGFNQVVINYGGTNHPGIASMRPFKISEVEDHSNFEVNDTNIGAVANVNLPDGAFVDKIRFSIVDDIRTVSGDSTFYRVDRLTRAREELARIDTNDSGQVMYIEEYVASPAINNEKYLYFLHAGLNDPKLELLSVDFYCLEPR